MSNWSDEAFILWSDVAFKARLLSDPAKAFREIGVSLTDGITMKVVENTDGLFHLILPPQPDDVFEDGVLDKVVREETFHWEGSYRPGVTEEGDSRG